jgi:type I restriction enzyme S subunit
VPESWVWVSGFDIFKPMTSKKPTNGTFTYIDINAIDNSKNCIVNPKVLEASNAPSRASREVKSGDTLFSMVRPYLMNIAYVDNQYKNSIASTGFFVCRPNELLFPKFLYYLMLSPFVVYGLNSFMKGDNSPSINNDNIISFQYPLPPLLEQYRIVDKIEKLFDLIYLINENKLSLEQYITQTKSKVLDLAIRGKLVPQDPEEEPASMLLKKIRKDDKIKRVSSDTSHYPFELPNGWEVTEMQNICSLLDGEKRNDISLPYLDVKFLRNQSGINLKKSGKFVSAETNLVLVDGENSGEIFKTNIDGYQGSTLKIIQISEEINEEYIFYILKKEHKLFKESKTGSAIPHLNKKLFREYPIPLPPLAEQKRIVSQIENIFAQLEIIEDSLKA